MSSKTDFNEMCQGYQVMMNLTDCAWWQGWVPINSSYGFPYATKGFAINRAKNLQNIYGKTSVFLEVIELKSFQPVWQSDNLKELGENL